jgi:hypothetical protein
VYVCAVIAPPEVLYIPVMVISIQIVEFYEIYNNSVCVFL